MKALANISILLVFMCVVSSVFLVPQVTLADTTGLFPCNGANNVPNTIGATKDGSEGECNFDDVIKLVQAAANWMVKIGLIVLPLLFAWAGWLLLTQGDNQNARKKARGILFDAVIGFVIMMLAWVIVNLILTALVDPTILNGSFPFKTEQTK